MNEEKQQKFTAKVRRGLVWVSAVASQELANKKAAATGVRIEGFTAAELADVEMHAIQTSGNCIRNTTSDHLAGVTPPTTAGRPTWPDRPGRAARRRSPNAPS